MVQLPMIFGPQDKNLGEYRSVIASSLNYWATARHGGTGHYVLPISVGLKIGRIIVASMVGESVLNHGI